jgi:hypothetical protein
LRLAASVVVAALALACGGDVTGPATLPTSDLLVLPLQAGAPAVPPATFWASNARLAVGRLLHADAQNTLYLEARFPARTLASLDGQPLTLQDSVQVTIEPSANRYGFTLSPRGLAFSIDQTPTATLSFAVYGDFSVADGSPTYPSRAAYADALQFWLEVTPGRWRPVAGSGPAGLDAVAGPLSEPGVYVVAAPR